MRLLLFLIYSPMSVRQMIVVIRNVPGITIIHQLPESSAVSDIDIREPHETVSIGRPSHKKLKVASIPMAAPTLLTTMNMIELMKLGARCLRTM